MAIKQSPWGKNNRTAVTPHTAGAVHVQRFTYEHLEDVAAVDILELGILPGYATIVDAQIITEGAHGAITANVGFMSGDVGSTDVARTLGTELYAAQSLSNTATVVARMVKPDAALSVPTVKDRSIGVQFGALVALAVGKKFHLVLTYAQ